MGGVIKRGCKMKIEFLKHKYMCDNMYAMSALRAPTSIYVTCNFHFY